MHYLLGIDEAGRGPWAGPVVAGGFLMEISLIGVVFPGLTGLTDSKLLDEKNRDRIFTDIKNLEKVGKCFTGFALRDASEIDRIGIREANRQCMEEVIQLLLAHTLPEDQIEIYIDGCDNYIFNGWNGEYAFAKKMTRKSKKSHQESHPIRENGLLPASQGREQFDVSRLYYIISGDKTIPVISAASIIAKVSRDRLMCEYSEKFPLYGFVTHKGYGTKKHTEALLNYGITPIHRKSYAPIKRLILGEG